MRLACRYARTKIPAAFIQLGVSDTAQHNSKKRRNKKTKKLSIPQAPSATDLLARQQKLLEIEAEILCLIDHVIEFDKLWKTVDVHINGTVDLGPFKVMLKERYEVLDDTVAVHAAYEVCTGRHAEEHAWLER